MAIERQTIFDAPFIFGADYDEVVRELGTGRYGLEIACGHAPSYVHFLQTELKLPSVPWVFTDSDEDQLALLDHDLENDPCWNRAATNTHPFYISHHFSMPDEILDAGIVLIRNPQLSYVRELFPYRKALRPGAHFIIALNYYGVDQIEQTQKLLTSLGFEGMFQQYTPTSDKRIAHDRGIHDIFSPDEYLFHYRSE